MLHIEVMGDRATQAIPGQVATAIAELSVPDVTIETVREPGSPDVLVYARRVKDTLGHADEYCRDAQVPLVVMSTGIDEAIPASTNYPLIIAPNTGLRVLRFMERVEEQASHLAGWDVVIEEHHQASKKDVSGTARKLAGMLNLDEGKIVPVRNFAASRLAYPVMSDANETSYAAHKVTFTNPDNGDQESQDIIVLGRSEYARGLLAICQAAQTPEVRQFIKAAGNRAHVIDLLREGMLD